jgi:hypothetical protein
MPDTEESRDRTNERPFIMSRMNLLTVTVALTAAFGVARSATAQTCTVDKDCPQSFTCVDSGAVINGTAPACPPNTACQPTSDLAPRKPQIVKSCQAKACTADSECGAGMVCFEEKSTPCSGGAAVAPCAPGADCPRVAPPEPTCVTPSRRLCAFKWQVPCNTDVDCGDGFTCHPQESGSCSSSSGTTTTAPAPTDAGTSGGGSTGSTGSGNGGGASADPATPGTKVSPPSDPICTETKKTFPGYCQPKVTRCAADSECPTTWTCMQQATPVSTPPAPTPGTAADGGSGPKSADPVPPDQGFAVPVRTCTPPGGLGVRGSDSTGGKGEVVSTPMTPGTPGTTTGGPQPVSMNPMVPPSAGGSGQSTAPSSGGCTIHDGSQTSQASGLALFTLLGLIAARRLRRR